MTIERSAGLLIRVDGVTYGFAGGGYIGITAELDQVVLGAAETLAAAYGKDVEIRFNSDRESGGAFLGTPDGSNADVGICASLVIAAARERWAWSARQYEAEAGGAGDLTVEQREGARELAAYWRQALADSPEGHLTVTAHIRGLAVAERLRAGLRQLPGWTGRETTGYKGGYHYGTAGSVDEALTRCLRFVPPGEAR